MHQPVVMTEIKIDSSKFWKKKPDDPNSQETRIDHFLTNISKSNIQSVAIEDFNDNISRDHSIIRTTIDANLKDDPSNQIEFATRND